MRPFGELGVSTALLAVASGCAWLVWQLPEAPGYSQVGPKVVPAVATAGLFVSGAVLMFEGLHGGFRARAPVEGDGFDARSFGWLTAGLVLHMALVGRIGFVAAATLLFVFTARGLGSERWVRDLGVGASMAAVLYGLFTGVLGLSLGPSVATLVRFAW
jgi:putative tricarboxylic transport membrane protein